MLKELLEMVEFVAKANVNTILFRWNLDGEPIAVTQHNGTFKACEAPAKLKKLVDFMVANNVAEISNWDNYDVWSGKLVRFDGNDKQIAKIMAETFPQFVFEKNGYCKIEVKLDSVKICATVSKEDYENALKVAA